MHSGNYLYKKTTLGVGREWGYCKEVFVQLFCSLPWMAISNRTQWGISQAGFIAACQGIKSADAKQTCWCYAYLHWASWGWLSTQVLQHRKQVRTDVFPLSKSYFSSFFFQFMQVKRVFRKNLSFTYSNIPTMYTSISLAPRIFMGIMILNKILITQTNFCSCCGFTLIAPKHHYTHPLIHLPQKKKRKYDEKELKG